jgi:WD40 repeat protein
VCLAGDGLRVAVASFESDPPVIKVLDLESGQELASWPTEADGSELSWSADGQLLACGSYRGRVGVWRVSSNQLASVLQGHTNAVIACRFAPTGHLLATASWDGTTRLWDAASGEPLATAPGEVRGFSQDGLHLVYQARNKLGVWQLAHAQQCRVLHPGRAGNRTDSADSKHGATAADFSPNGRWLAVASWDGVFLYEADTGLELAHLDVGLGRTVLFHPDGHSLITYSRAGLCRWPIQDVADLDRHRLRIGPRLVVPVNEDTWWKAAWLPGHRTVAAIKNDEARILLLNLAGNGPVLGQPEALLSRHDRMTSVAVSSDGRWAAAGGWKEKGIQIWDLPQRRLERILPPCPGRGEIMFFVAFSPDGRWLVSCTQNQEVSGYYFWRVGSWQQERVIPFKEAVSRFAPPVFSRDGRLMALSISPQQILLADPATGRTIAHLSSLQPIEATPLAFSPDGTRLAAATNQKTVLLWDLRAVRQELADRGLDWDRSAYPPADTPRKDKPVEVVVDPGK